MSEGSDAAEWVAAAGTISATATAVWIAVRQRFTEQRVLAGAQREKAAHTAIVDGPNRDKVTIRNFGQTPVTKVRIVRSEALLEEYSDSDGVWYAIGTAVARADPRRRDLLPAGDYVEFSFMEWRAEAEDFSIGPGNLRHAPEVTFQYTDAAGTLWRRKGHNLPEAIGGVPLPASAAERRRMGRRRAWKWLGDRRRNAWKSLKLGLRGEGFTAKRRQRRAQQRQSEPPRTGPP